MSRLEQESSLEALEHQFRHTVPPLPDGVGESYAWEINWLQQGIAAKDNYGWIHDRALALQEEVAAKPRFEQLHKVTGVVGKYAVKATRWAAGLSMIALPIGIGSAMARPTSIGFTCGQADVFPNLSGEANINLEIGNIIHPTGSAAGADIVGKNLFSCINFANPSEQDLQEVAVMLSSFDELGAKTSDAVFHHAEQNTETIGYSAALLLAGAAELILGSSGRKKLGNFVFSKEGLAVGLMAFAALGAVGYRATEAAQHHEAPNIDPIFNTTPLKNSTIKGPTLEYFLNTYGAQVVQYFNNLETYKQKALPNYEHELTEAPLLRSREGATTLVWLANIKCNTLMDDMYSRLIQDVNPDAVVLSADTVVGYGPLDDWCTGKLAQAIGNRLVIVTMGDHRTKDLIKQLQARGFNVLTGDVFTGAGSTFLGASDQLIAEWGKPPMHQDMESPEVGKFDPNPVTGVLDNTTLGDRLAQKACQSGNIINFGVASNRDTGDRLAASGCFDVVIGGDRDNKLVMVQGPNGRTTYEQIGMDSGGIDYGEFTIGITPSKQSPATAGVLQLTHDTNVYSDQTVSYTDDASVQFSPIDSYQLPPPVSAGNGSHPQ